MCWHFGVHASELKTIQINNCGVRAEQKSGNGENIAAEGEIERSCYLRR